MFSFFKKKPTPDQPAAASPPADAPAAPPAPVPEPGDKGGAFAWLRKPFGGGAEAPPPAAPEPTPEPIPEPTPKPQPEAARQGWMDRLKSGLRKTGTSIATVFTGTQINDALYEELEDALLMADTGVKATQHLLADLKRRVKEAKATEPAQVKVLLQDAIAELLGPLEKSLVVGEYHPR